jgi:hypothetical protein
MLHYYVRYGIIFMNESNAKTFIFFMRCRHFFDGLFVYAFGGFAGHPAGDARE